MKEKFQIRKLGNNEKKIITAADHNNKNNSHNMETSTLSFILIITMYHYF